MRVDDPVYTWAILGSGLVLLSEGKGLGSMLKDEQGPYSGMERDILNIIFVQQHAILN